MKCKKCGMELEVGNKCPKCGSVKENESIEAKSSQVKKDNSNKKKTILGISLSEGSCLVWIIITIVLTVALSVLGVVIGIKGIDAAADIASLTFKAEFYGFFNGRAYKEGYNKDILDEYPYYYPAQKEIWELYINYEGLTSGDDIYGYSDELEKLHTLDPYITYPSLQQELDDKISYYEGLIAQIEANLYDNIFSEKQIVISQENVVEPLTDISDLHVMDNYYYVEYDGEIYFRQYNAESMKAGSLYAELGYSTNPSVAKDFMCIKENGEIVKTGEDYGVGPMYLVEKDGKEPCIYSTRVNDEGRWQIYSFGLNLSYPNVDVIYTEEANNHQGEPQCLKFVGRTESKLFFTNEYESLLYIDLENNDKVVKMSMNLHDWFAFDETAVYAWYNDDIYAHHYTGEEELIVQIPEEELFEGYEEIDDRLLWDYFLSVSDAEVIGDKIYFQLIATEKEDSFVHWGSTMILDLKNKTCTIIPEMKYSEFNIVQDGANTWIYYPVTAVDEQTGENYRYAVSVHVEGSGETPLGVSPWAESGTVSCAENGNGEKCLIATPYHSAHSYMVLSGEEMKALEIGFPTIYEETSEETIWKIVRAECVGEKMFFSVEISTHVASLDEEGKPYYQRQMTYDYCKNLSTGEILLLNSY